MRIQVVEHEIEKILRTFKTLTDFYQMDFGFIDKGFKLRYLKLIQHHHFYLFTWMTRYFNHSGVFNLQKQWINLS